MGAGLSLALSIGVPLTGGFIGSIVSTPDILTWYNDIKKPKWTPPKFIFGPMWTIMYIAQGTASWFVLQKKGVNKTLPMALYAIQLAFNMAWNPIFFKTHKTDVATADAAAILGFATAATVAMTNATSAAIQLPLMVPYLVWVAYATALSGRICQLNPTERLYQYKALDSKTDAAVGLKNDPGASSKDPAPKPVTDVMKAAHTAATEAVQAAKSTADAVKSGEAPKVPASRSDSSARPAEPAKPADSGKAAESVKPAESATPAVPKKSESEAPKVEEPAEKASQDQVPAADTAGQAY